MASTTSASLGASTTPDLAKETAGYVAAIPAGAGVAAVLNPSPAMRSVSAVNPTGNLLRATVTFSADIASSATPLTRTFLIPPRSAESVNFFAANDSGQVGSIDSVSVIAVIPGILTAEASTLAVATNAVAGVAYFNFAA